MGSRFPKILSAGREFIVETDNKALQWLEKMQDPKSKITWWYLAMQPFRFVVLYVPGKANDTDNAVSEVPKGEGSVMVDDQDTRETRIQVLRIAV